MALRLRVDSPNSQSAVRRVLGVDVSSGCRRVRAAPIVAHGNGLHLNVRAGKPVEMELPSHAAELWCELVGKKQPGGQNPFHALAELRSVVTEHVAIAAQEAAGTNGGAFDQTLALGVHAPGRITATGQGPRDYVGLIDAAQLADLSGVNIVEGFPARDLAAGGRGGPLPPLPLWILFRSAHSERILLHLGRETRLTRLPCLTGSLSTVSGLAHRTIVGMGLIDLLVRQLTDGCRPHDVGGRLAVQGRRVEQLVEGWMGMSHSQPSPLECQATSLLHWAVAAAVEHGWSIYDVLCSATHFVADSAARNLAEMASGGGPLEVLLSGGGQANGLVLRRLTAQLPDCSLTRIDQLGTDSAAIAPAVAAILALLYLDQVPANVAGLTGADIPRTLGRLTPGSPQAWQKLLASCTTAAPSLRPLRAAL